MKTSIQRALGALCVLGVLAQGAAAVASSHREAPLITQDPTVDSTDTYMFRSPEDPTKVVLLANYIPFQEPAGGPNYFNFSDTAQYRINIDNTGDARADIVYAFNFRTEVTSGETFLYNVGPMTTPADHVANRNVKQYYTVTRVDIDEDGNITSRVIVEDALTAPARIGPRSNGTQGQYEALVRSLIQSNNGTRTFVGPRDEGFYLDINAIFDLLNIDRVAGLGTDTALDGTAGFNVSTLALEVPISALTADGSVPVFNQNNLGGPNAVLGMWTSAHRPKHRVLRRNRNPREFGPLVQVSRLGLPLVNEVVVPLGFKDQFNRSQPHEDLGNIAGFVVDPELSRLLNAVHGIEVPPAPRGDMVAVISFLPGALTSRDDLQPADLLRLNVSIPPTAPQSVNRLGVIGGDVGGFPNGRRPGDDVVDILERVVGGGILSSEPTSGGGSFGELFPNNALNDGVNANDVPYLSTFPFLGTPHEGFEHDHDDFND